MADMDLSLLQCTAASLIPADTFVAALVHRFRAGPYLFSGTGAGSGSSDCSAPVPSAAAAAAGGKPGTASGASKAYKGAALADEAPVLCEAMLRLLVLVVSDRLCSRQMSARQRAETEVLHQLYLAPQPFSAVAEALSTGPSSKASVEDADNVARCKAALGKLARYSEPTATESGAYHLRREFYDSFDPYFTHYRYGRRREESCCTVVVCLPQILFAKFCLPSP
jgi:hypothetical protein